MAVKLFISRGVNFAVDLPESMLRELGASFTENQEEADLVILGREEAAGREWELVRSIKQRPSVLVAVVERSTVLPPLPIDGVDDFLPPRPEEIRLRVANLLRVAAVRQSGVRLPGVATSFFSSAGLLSPLRVDLRQGIGEEKLIRLLGLLREALNAVVVLLFPADWAAFQPPTQWEFVDSPYCRTLLQAVDDQGVSLCRYAHWLAGVRAVGEKQVVHISCPGGLLLEAAPIHLEFFGIKYPLGVLVAGLGEAPLGAVLKEVGRRYRIGYSRLRQAAGLARRRSFHQDELVGRNLLQAAADYLGQEISQAYLRAYKLIAHRSEEPSVAVAGELGESMVGRLAAALFHEIRNPLTSIKGVLQLLYERREEGDPERRYLEVILGELDRAVRIIRNFLYFARPRECHPELTDLDFLMRDIVLMLEPQAAASKVELFYQPTPGLSLFPVDPDLLKQAILNLAQNALQAMPQGGKLYLRLYPWQEGVAIEVEDSGVGIPPEHLTRLGEAFFTTRREGTGLGLAVSYQIVRLHGGTIEVESEEGRGTKFTIRLPRQPAEAED
ncbi:ATP-binding protein [Desulfothermobacter acidiphilus]|uniref:ATP-binding protein n=1 Tax=Desulfothermobacter acidiphilus TaxID=1938353 RepID=UPI003F8CC781